MNSRTRRSIVQRKLNYRLRDEEETEEYEQQSEQQRNLETSQPIEKRDIVASRRATVNQIEEHGRQESVQQPQPQIRQKASGGQVMTPSTQRASVNPIEEHIQQESVQKSQPQISKQASGVQGMAPGTRRATANQMEEHEQQSQPQISQQASGGQQHVDPYHLVN